MIDVDDHHLGGAARGAARLDGARGAVADLQEAHQARRLAAARQLLVGAAQVREVGAGAGAVLEEARFAHPQVHDAVLVDEIVLDRLDEAGVRLRMLVGRVGDGQLAGLVVDVEVALARAVDAIGPVQAGVEPLRGVGRGHLHGQHVAVLVEEGARVLLGGEVAALPAPVGPGAGEAIEHLARVGLAAEALFLGQLGQGALVGDGAPEPGRNLRLFDLLQAAGDAGLAEILLRQDVGGDLAPVLRHLEAVEAEDDRAVGVLDLAGRAAELDGLVGRLAGRRKAPRDLHKCPPCLVIAGRRREYKGAMLFFASHGCVGSGHNSAVGGSATRLRLPPTRCLDWVDGPGTGARAPEPQRMSLKGHSRRPRPRSLKLSDSMAGRQRVCVLWVAPILDVDRWRIRAGKAVDFLWGVRSALGGYAP